MWWGVVEVVVGAVVRGCGSPVRRDKVTEMRRRARGCEQEAARFRSAREQKRPARCSPSAASFVAGPGGWSGCGFPSSCVQSAGSVIKLVSTARKEQKRVSIDFSWNKSSSPRCSPVLVCEPFGTCPRPSSASTSYRARRSPGNACLCALILTSRSPKTIRL